MIKKNVPFLGMTLDNKMNCNTHLDDIKEKKSAVSKPAETNQRQCLGDPHRYNANVLHSSCLRKYLLQ